MMPRGRIAARLLVLGTLAGAAAAAIAAWANVGLCSQDPHGACVGLVRSLSLRVGLLAGAATVLMILTAMGLTQTIALDEERRMARPGGHD